MDAVRWQGTSLALLDQTKLPTQVVWDTYTDYRPVVDAIRQLVVRGAPAIGVAAAYAFCLAALSGDDLKQAKADLAASRPTAVNLFWALDRMERCSESCGGDPATLIKEAEAIHAEDIAMNHAIGEAGLSVVPEHARILTHCNAGAIATGGYGTALGVVRAAHEAGRVDMVYCDETRPLLQGARLTAWELVEDGIPATLLCDNMAGFAMQKGKIDLVLLGCDRMAANGDGANKIGTSGVAILAKEYGIPFYMYVPTSTIDLATPTGEEIEIEERKGEEIYKMWYEKPMAPEGIKTFNPAFDVTDNKNITAVITEKGIVYPPYDINLRKIKENE